MRQRAVNAKQGTARKRSAPPDPSSYFSRSPWDHLHGTGHDSAPAVTTDNPAVTDQDEDFTDEINNMINAAETVQQEVGTTANETQLKILRQIIEDIISAPGSSSEPQWGTPQWIEWNENRQSTTPGSSSSGPTRSNGVSSTTIGVAVMSQLAASAQGARADERSTTDSTMSVMTTVLITLMIIVITLIMTTKIGYKLKSAVKSQIERVRNNQRARNGEPIGTSD